MSHSNLEETSGKSPVLGENIDHCITPQEDETKKNTIAVSAPSKWKCPWCELSTFDEVTTADDCEAHSCYQCGAIGVIGKVHATNHIIDTGMTLHGLSDAIIQSQGSDRVHGLSEQGIEMKSGYLEMEEHANEGSQALWFRKQS